VFRKNPPAFAVQDTQQDPDSAPLSVGPEKPVLRHRFFFVYRSPPKISRYEKIFCVVKNHAARHKTAYCNRGNIVSQYEITSSMH